MLPNVFILINQKTTFCFRNLIDFHQNWFHFSDSIVAILYILLNQFQFKFPDELCNFCLPIFRCWLRYAQSSLCPSPWQLPPCAFCTRAFTIHTVFRESVYSEKAPGHVWLVRPFTSSAVFCCRCLCYRLYVIKERRHSSKRTILYCGYYDALLNVCCRLLLYFFSESFEKLSGQIIYWIEN